MRVLRGSADRGPVAAKATLAGAIAVLALAAVGGLSARQVVPVIAVLAVATVAYRIALSWRPLLALLILVILFVPIRRYVLPGHLPFDLELYRVLAALLLLGWLCSLLVDPRVRLRKSGFAGPLFLIGYGALLSEIFNNQRITDLDVSSYVVKGLMFLASFLLIFLLLVNVVRRQDEIDFLVKTLVGGGTFVAAMALVERATGYNLFNHVGSVIPLLKLESGDLLTADSLARGGRLRVYASAQHPIALGAMLVMLIPLALYLATRFKRNFWWFCAGMLFLGSAATASRTSVVMLGVIMLALLRMRPREARRLWPVLICAVLAVPLVAPGSIATLRNAFMPQGGLVAQQQSAAVGHGRLADVGPTIDEWQNSPVFGEGYATRVTDGAHPNAPILDDQWLKTLVETGIVGVAAWLWLFGRGIRRLWRVGRRENTPRGLLCSALAASLLGFVVGMFLYDAFSFIQVTFVAFIMLALGASTLLQPEESTPRPA